VQLSPEPDDKDVYYNKAIKLFSITGQGLKKISICGNVEWNIDKCTPIDRVKDYVSFQAVGGIRKADGNLYQEKNCADLDILAFREDLVEKYNGKQFKTNHKKYNNGDEPSPDYINYCIERDFRQKRVFMLPETETKAKNRVIRSLFSVKQGYTKRELTNPFVILRFSFILDVTDKDIKQMLAMQFIGSSRSVYGEQKRIPDAEIIDVKPEEPHSADGEDGDTTPPDDNTAPPEQDSDETPPIPPDDEEVFKAHSFSEQCDVINGLIKKKKYDKKKMTKGLDKFTPDQMIKFFNKLNSMKDAK